MTGQTHHHRPVGVLALQGDFPLHTRSLEQIGAVVREIRLPADLSGLAGLIIPGGESTTMMKLAGDYGLIDPLRRMGQAGLPIFGTCAGAILLGCGTCCPERLELVPVTVERNAYGTQRESFEKDIRLQIDGAEHHCIFIRAPKIKLAGDPQVEVLGRDGNDPILLRYKNYLLATFHPELTGDPSIHRYFLRMCRS